jgi:hypothetical protein
VAFFLKPRKKATATDVDKLQLVGVACAKRLYELKLVSHDKLKAYRTPIRCGMEISG